MAKDTPPPSRKSAAPKPRPAHKPRRAAAKGTRLAQAGDTAPRLGPKAIQQHVVRQATLGKQDAQGAAVRDILRRAAKAAPGEAADALKAILAGASPDEVDALRRVLFEGETAGTRRKEDPDIELSPRWREGGYPYKNLLSRKNYEEQKYRLQVELLKLQAWVKESGQRVVILFEGRDAAGKGGTIKRFMEHLNPRGARVVALEKPREVERGQWYFQRYIAAPADARRDRAVRPQLVQPRRRRAGDGLLHRRRVRRVHAPGARVRASPGAQRRAPLQVLVLGQPRGAAPPLQGAAQTTRSSSGS